MNEMKTMNYQDYVDYLNNDMIEICTTDVLDVAVETANDINEVPTRYDFGENAKAEIISLVWEDSRMADDVYNSRLVEDGFVVVVHCG
jgi:hypothetical protein